MEQKKPPYVWAVVVVFFLTLLAILALISFQPDKDHTQEIITIVGMLAPTIASILAVMKAQETHLSVNSRLDNFIEASAKSGREQGDKEGYARGQEDANARTDALKKS